VSRLLLVGSCLLLVGLLLLVALTGCDLTAPAAGAPPVATTYLMAPPRYALDKPLREWQQLGTYPSVQACNVDRNTRFRSSCSPTSTCPYAKRPSS
jgi:hypothetical protein